MFRFHAAMKTMIIKFSRNAWCYLLSTFAKAGQPTEPSPLVDAILDWTVQSDPKGVHEAKGGDF